ncbi:FAD dependent oxidoreductase [Aspergillus californicus]
MVGFVSEPVLREMLQRDPGIPKTRAILEIEHGPLEGMDEHTSTLPDLRDFVVIGSGITGCSVAHSLLNHPAFQDKTVAVLEARELASGATGYTESAILPIAPIAVGEERGQALTPGQLQEAATAAVAFKNVETITNILNYRIYVEWLINKSTMDMHFHTPGGLWTLYSPEEAKRDYRLLETEGVCVSPGATLRPRYLVLALFKEMMRRWPSRCMLQTHTAVTDVCHTPQGGDHPYVVTTRRGSIRAASVIICINGWTSHLIPSLRGKILPQRACLHQLRAPRVDTTSGTRNHALDYLVQHPAAGFTLSGGSQKCRDVYTSDDTQERKNDIEQLWDVLPSVFNRDGDSCPFVSNEGRTRFGIAGITTDKHPFVGCLNWNWKYIPTQIYMKTGYVDHEHTVPTARHVGRTLKQLQYPHIGVWVAAGCNRTGLNKCWLMGEALVGMIASEDVTDRIPDAYLATIERFRNMGSCNIRL